MPADPRTVVTLQRPTSPTSTSAHVGRLPVLLTQVRDKAALELKRNLQALFDNADDTLFQMADRAASNSEQNDLFEAMRELRLQRKVIERSFLQKLFENFAQLARYSLDQPPALLPVSLEGLSLVDNSELEETVAVDAMVGKVLGRDGQALSQLTTRINALVSQKIEDKENPLGPRALCSVFLEGCRALGAEIRIKLIILKLFDRYVMSEMSELYATANQTLIEGGVLPELKSVAPTRRPGMAASAIHSAAPADAALVGSDEAGSAMQEAFSMFQQLMGQLRGTAFPARNVPADAVPVSSTDLLRLLSHLQQQLPEEDSPEQLRGRLDGLLTRASAKSGKTRVVGQVDDDALNLISMLFEFILDDRALPDSLKALIGRLQIPMLKVAVIDKAFFARGNHPARRLLNEIASAALGWNAQDDAQRDSLYQKIEQIVQRLLNEFDNDPQIFAELLADFIAFTGSEQRRSELLEQRTRDAEEGRAKAEQARLKVEQELNERLLGKTLPQVVVRLLQEGWSKLLLLVLLKQGEESEAWQHALNTMDDLVWSVGEQPTAEDRLRLLQTIPSLLRALREGLTEAAIDPFETSALFAELEALHVQRFQLCRREEEVSEQLSAEVEQAVANAAEVLPQAAEPLPEQVQLVAPSMVEVVEEIVLLPPGERPITLEDSPEPVDDQALQQVDDLRVGSWLEIAQEPEQKLRCKLAAIIKPTGKYIFVNRTGMKVLEKTRMGLAVEFRRQAIRLLDDALLFDRALESVIGNLRRLKNA